MHFPAIATNGTALRHSAAVAPTIPAIEEDGDITLHPDLSAAIPRGGDPETDFDRERIRQIVEEADGLAVEAQSNPIVNPHAPAHRACGNWQGNPGCNFVDAAGRKCLALHGLIGRGHTFDAAAAAWLDHARKALAQ